MNLLYRKITFCVVLLCGLATSCDEDFIEANRNPDVLNDISPENQFLSATLSLHSQDFEAFYDRKVVHGHRRRPDGS